MPPAARKKGYFLPVPNVAMKKDPIVEEVRKIREAHASKFNYDLKRICQDLKESSVCK